MSDSDDIKSVFVSNISPSADQKTINDFFSFCGRIVSLSLQETAGGDGGQESVVEFESASAAKTALLLTNAVIVDRTILVEPLSAEHNKPKDSALMDPEAIAQKEFTVGDAERSKTSVIASLAAAGYSVGGDALSKARAYDDKHMITTQLKAGAENIKAKAKEIDAQYKISETVSAGAKKVSAKAQEIDDRMGFSAMAQMAVDTVTATVSTASAVVVNKAMANETVASTVHKAQETTSAASQRVKKEFADLKGQTEAEIEKREASKQHQQHQQQERQVEDDVELDGQAEDEEGEGEAALPSAPKDGTH